VASSELKGWRDCPRLALLNLKYDAMPAGVSTLAEDAGTGSIRGCCPRLGREVAAPPPAALTHPDNPRTPLTHPHTTTLARTHTEYVTMVVTEFGMIPPSSVPVILREFSESAQLE
jgi:hypothetical protein